MTKATRATGPDADEAKSARPLTKSPTQAAEAKPATTVSRIGAVEKKAPTEGETAAEAEVVPGRESEGTATDRWAKLIADPGHAPELLALAAVETIGPRAREWAAATSAAYPTATPDALARLATRQFGRFGAVASAFGAVAGSYAALALVAARGLTQAELILHLAAAHGLDPTDPRRAVDLLVISRVHETAAEAEAAVAEARGAQSPGSPGDALWRLGRAMAPQLAAWAALRSINRAYPGTSLTVAILTSASSAQGAAARATSYYRSVSG